jgi:hypothetical protein
MLVDRSVAEVPTFAQPISIRFASFRFKRLFRQISSPAPKTFDLLERMCLPVFLARLVNSQDKLREAVALL